MTGNTCGLSTAILVMSEDSFLLTVRTIELLSDDNLSWVVVLITKAVFVGVEEAFMTDDCAEVETMNAGVGINPEPRHGLCGILGPLVSSVGVVFTSALICVFV